jgi:alginate O-acetyltransferase complex protein AlgI
LGGNRRGEFRTQCNLMMTMLLGGLWHGANWTYVIWGAYHGLLLMAQRFIAQLVRKKSPDTLQKPGRLIWLIKIIFCFHAIVVGWMIFRAESITQVVTIFRSFFVNFNPDDILHRDLVLKLAFYIVPLCFIQTLQFWKDDLLAVLSFSIPVRTTIYVIMFYLIVIFGVYGTQNFIYFQF